MIDHRLSPQSARPIIEDYIDHVLHQSAKQYLSQIDFTKYVQYLHLGCITRFNAALGEATANNAIQLLPIWKEALEQEKNTAYIATLPDVGIRLMFNDLIPVVKIGDLNHKFIGRTVMLKGAISSFPEQRVSIECKVVCPNCQAQLKSDRRMRTCYCCDKSIPRDMWNASMQTFQDLQFVEHIDNSAVNRSINIFTKKHEVEEYNVVTPYDVLFNTIEIIGVVHYNEQIKKFEIEIFNVRTLDDMQLNPNQIKDAEEFIAKNQDNIHVIIRKHICPHIFGMDNQIYLMATTIIGCSGEEDLQLKNRNQQMMYLSIGKFGRGKSDIAKSFIPYLPNAAVINTMSASSAGLKSGIAKDDKGQYTLILGTLPRCHNSFAVLEELDKVKDQANDYLQTISEGKVRLDKIIQFEKKIHVNYIVNGNPKHGDFDTMSTYFSQIDLPSPFIDRADIIVIPPAPFDNNTINQFTKRVIGDDIEPSPYSNNLIRSVMIYLKRYTHNPIITDDGFEVIVEYWKTLKESLKNVGGLDEQKTNEISIEVRQLISLIKFIKGWGRFHAYSKMDDPRCRISLKILKEGSHDTYMKLGGTSFLTSSIETARKTKIPENQQQRRDFIIANISNHPKGIEETQLYNICAKVNMTNAAIADTLKKLLSSTEVKVSYVSGKTFYSLGVIEGIVQMEYIEQPSCVDWVMEKLKAGELSDDDIVRCTEYSQDELEETIKILKKNGDIYEVSAGKLRRMM